MGTGIEEEKGDTKEVPWEKSENSKKETGLLGRRTTKVPVPIDTPERIGENAKPKKNGHFEGRKSISGKGGENAKKESRRKT